MTDLALPDENTITENLSKILGLPVDFLTYFAENKTQIKDFMEAIRPDIGLMAEVKLMEHVASGDKTVLMWVLPRMMPKQYNLSNKSPGDSVPDNVRVIFGDDE